MNDLLHNVVDAVDAGNWRSWSGGSLTAGRLTPHSLLLGRLPPHPTQTLDYVEALDDLDYVEALDDYVEPYSNLLFHLLVRGAAPGAASGAFAFDELLLAVPGATPGTFTLLESSSCTANA